MTNYKHLGNIVEARRNYTEDELIKKNLDNLINAKVTTVLPVEDAALTVSEMYRMAKATEVTAKNVEAYASQLTIRKI